jgi:Bacterial membrane protein YfhO
MKKGLLKKMIPHLVAFLVFLVVALVYCKPALEGKVLYQHDITHWKGAIHNSQMYKEVHGHYPLWTNSLFSGMPAFQIGYDANNRIPWYAHELFTLGLPVPVQFFFLACICFYFLGIVLGVNPYVTIMGALAFGYATYNPVIIFVGHDTKMWSIAYMPALLASVILIYEKKYWLGAALTALFTSVLIAMNHPQIDYYIFIAIAIMTVFYVISWIKQKNWKHFAIAVAFTGAAAVTGVLANAVTIMSTYEYQKETIRGGGSVLTDSTHKNTKSQTGLDKDYAFSYSMNISEPFVMMVPRIYGGSSGYPTMLGGDGYKEMNEDNSKALEALQQMPQQLGQQIAESATLYWGGIGGTSGPPYVGAIICFLAILSFFVLDGKHKWWAITAIGVTIMMSWGSYFKEFNYFLYDYLPLYNKFRAPSMVLVIPQLLLPMLAILGVNAYINTADKKSLLPKFKKGMIATAVVFAILFMMYLSFSFLSKSDSDLLNQVRNMNQSQLYESVKPFFDGLKADRKGLMLEDIFRSLGFIAVAALTLFLFIRNKIKPLAAIIVLILFAFTDVITIDNKYLNSDNYQDKLENENSFQKTKADEEILADTSSYRVLNMAGDRFAENITSYYYNSVGGYHPAKILIYQDLIEKQLSKEQLNMPVLNMLNTKYLIQKDQRTGQTKSYQKNEGALGPCWFVKNIQFVKNADEEMNALDHFNPKDTAIVQESFRSAIPFMPQPDSSASIHLIKNDNDVVTYVSVSTANQFAVFSEVYYKSGWKAWVDGKEAPIVKVNYVLRGLALPAGKHTIEFRFEPAGYKKGKSITSIFSVLLLLLLAGGIFMEWRNNKGSAPAKA